MKLRWQLFCAFMVVTISGVATNIMINYNPVMNLLLLDQRLSMRQEANRWLDQLNTGGVTTADWNALASTARTQGCNVALVSENLAPIRNSFPSTPTIEFIQQSLKGGGIYEFASKQYVMVGIQYFANGQKYVLFVGAPPNWYLLFRTAFIKLAELMLSGILVSGLISVIMSHRVSKPLLKLNNELKKVAKLRFTEVEVIHASGEVGEVAQSFYVLSQELQRAILSEKQFFRQISHELRTPLMAIQGYAEGIRDGVFKGQAARSGLEVIVDESVRLKKLVDELIQLSKAEGSPHREPLEWSAVNVNDVLQEAITVLHPLLLEGQCNIKTSFNCAGTVFLNRNRLLQALINVLVNAIRYAENSIQITTVCSGDHMVVEIRDDGPGIPDEIIDNIFHSFVKGAEGQTGLGLYIAKQVISEFQGTISATNDIQKGAVFRISLPLYNSVD